MVVTGERELSIVRLVRAVWNVALAVLDFALMIVEGAISIEGRAVAAWTVGVGAAQQCVAADDSPGRARGWRPAPAQGNRG